MAAPDNTVLASDLPAIKRHITTHDAAGRSTYSDVLPEKLEFWRITTAAGASAGFELGYTTDALPVPLAGDQDLAAFQATYAAKQQTGLVRHGGTVLRYCDIPPHSQSPMHRTTSLDYGILVAGELQCLLDSGESRTIRPGDLVVQRATMHQWNNTSDKWARIVFLLFDATPPEINGKPLVEDQGGMGVPDSH
ncbi:hypothetical protein Micbo1qcDRAFT_223644 [Microdochium bolleyi]|uniref:Cupin 2 conserved barrel domain-containing protein n=1 Tax=Microdochium bolleyi TaxID=196109 RepID=A0A136IKE9_9PEZI|nr:hypothetical protein Micbo1qcDRAFT_223644 [Microdochium bolleyi]